MDVSSLHDLGLMENLVFSLQQWPLDSEPNWFEFTQPVLDDFNSSEVVDNRSPLIKQLKTTSCNNNNNEEGLILKAPKLEDNAIISLSRYSSSCSSNISFAAVSEESNTYDVVTMSSPRHELGANKRLISTKARRERASADEHVLAERKRRERLTQRFIALSALLPGLKKMDKGSILEDAIKYLKQLQDKVKILEDQTNKKYDQTRADYNSSDDDKSMIISSNTDHQQLPEIEAKICNKDVLIQIHCENKKGVLPKTVGEIEKLNLSVVNSSIMTFGDSSLSISLVAQTTEKFNSNIKELVENLRGALMTG